MEDETSQPGTSKEKTPEKDLRRAYLNRFQAIRAAIGTKSDLASEWNTDDLIAVFVKLRAMSLTHENIVSLAREFENTSIEDIQNLIQTLEDVVIEAETSRFQHANFVTNPEAVLRLRLSDDEFDAAKRLSEIATSQSTKKKICVLTSERLKDSLTILSNDESGKKKFPVSSDVFCPGVEYEDEVNYSDIYKFLSEAVIFKKPKPLKPLESAIVMSIFNDIQALADDYFDEHVEFFREFLADVDTMKSKDLTVLKMEDDQIGKGTWNVFNLPDDLMDLSGYVSSNSKEEGGVMEVELEDDATPSEK